MTHSLRHAACVWLPWMAAFYFCPVSSQASPTDAPRHNLSDAFLPLPAANVESVLEQVQSDPAVRRHYARYFHLRQSRVAAYLRANLVRARLTQGGQYTVYHVRPDGLIYPTLLTVPGDSPVFSLRGGPPLLTWGEGDPLAPAKKSVHVGTGTESAPALAESAPPRQIIVPTQVQTTIVPPPPAPVPSESSPRDSRQAAGKP